MLLHVGCPKTGTSYLQDVLFRNQRGAARARHPLSRRSLRRPLPGRARPDDAAVGRAGDRGRRRVGPARRPGARVARHLDHQPRDLRARHADAGRPGARRSLRRRRGAPRAVGARPGPPDPRGVAGERQAPQPHHLRPVPARPSATRRATRGSGRGSGPCRRCPTCSTGGVRAAARARPPRHRAAVRRRPGRAVAAVLPHLRARRPAARPDRRAREPVAGRARDLAAAHASTRR